MTKTRRFGSWKALGLPDMRGFTPHLRVINLYRDSASGLPDREAGAPVPEERLWLVHDLMHVAFYDFAASNLGRDFCEDHDRFLEVHLASEAFAVLALDYHHLIHTRTSGLAVDLNVRKWSAFQKTVRELPDPTSYEFCKNLVEFYLGGAGSFGRLDLKALTPAFVKWWGHEARYAEKQRRYVLMWLEDLMGREYSNQTVALEGSFVSEAVWELLRLFHRAPEKEWNAYVKDRAGEAKKTDNYFSAFPKYRKKKNEYDFRFTDVLGLSGTEVLDALEKCGGPSPSGLFLFWQILSMTTPQILTPAERRAVRALAHSAQTRKVNLGAWRKVHELTARIGPRQAFGPISPRRATFFLP